jgi:hypothetical protein
MLPAIIGAAASLGGALINKNAQDKANAANLPVNQVAQWEAAGINPIFGISSGGWIPQQASSFGDGFAKAGGIFADQIAGAKEQELRETRLELENELLKKELDKSVKDNQPGQLQKYGGVMPMPGVNQMDGQKAIFGVPAVSAAQQENEDRIGMTDNQQADPYMNMESNRLDAQQVADVYGDLAGNIHGMGRFVDDVWTNVKEQWNSGDEKFKPIDPRDPVTGERLIDKKRREADERDARRYKYGVGTRGPEDNWAKRGTARFPW